MEPGELAVAYRQDPLLEIDIGDAQMQHFIESTHKHPNVQRWRMRHPRFVPTSSSWLNRVERWFGELTSKAVRSGSFTSVADLQTAIAQFLEAWNQDPKPFVWTATGTACSPYALG